MRLTTLPALAALLLLTGAGAPAAQPLTEAEVRAFMGTVEFAARARDVQRLAGTLAAECRIELRTQIDGQEHVTLLTRDEYVAMLSSGYAAMHQLQSYDYEVTAQTITLERDAQAATVVSQVTETVVFANQRLVTRSEETSRVERRGGRLAIVAVSALTTGG